MTTDTGLPLPATPDGELLPAAGRLGAKARAYAARSRAPNTLRAYRQAWADFTTWCRWMGYDPLVGDPYRIGLYLAHCADRLKLSSIRLRLSGIAEVHRRAGQPFDPRHPDIAAVMDGIARTLGSARRKVAPVLSEQLREMVAALPDTPVGVRDRALLLVGFGAALRRSELVALDLADVRITEEGVRLTIRRSKTDQEGRGEEVAIHRGKVVETCAARALDAWLKRHGTAPGPLFQQIVEGGRIRPERLSAMAVVRAVKAAAAAVGLEAAEFSGHSLRAGL